MSYAAITYTYEKRVRRALQASQAAYTQARELGGDNILGWYCHTRQLHSIWKLDC